MRTKNAFRILALTLALPTLLMTTACSYNERLTDADEAYTVKNGREFPVIVNVVSQIQATRAYYNTETMKLNFNSGDQLLVSGYHAKAGQFAGLLTWRGGSTFEGMLNTEQAYSGTGYELLDNATATSATVLPNDYLSYGYLSVRGSGFSAMLDELIINKAFADTKAHGVEQLSYIHAEGYKNGFALAAGNAIMSCTIMGLTAGEQYTFTATDGTVAPTGTVITDSEGNGTFTVAFTPNGAKTYSIRIGDGSEYRDIDIGAKKMEEGCIYTVRTAAKKM